VKGICPQSAPPGFRDFGIDNDPLFVHHFEKLWRKAPQRDMNLTSNIGPRVGKLSS